MIQLNLLPDVKLEYIKAQRAHRLMLSISILVAGVAVALLVVLFAFNLAQKKHLSDLNRDIKSESSELEQKPQINKVLTVQNQLESLTTLHDGKPAASRLIDTYLNQITPSAVSINTFHIDFTAQTATITGVADSLSTVNKYVDTLKFTTYTSDTNKSPTDAFSNVVLTSFSVSSAATDKSQSANYTIDFAYDKNIFDITQNINLSVPNLITTRSELAQPGSDLFKGQPVQPTAKPASGGGT